MDLYKCKICENLEEICYIENDFFVLCSKCIKVHNINLVCLNCAKKCVEIGITHKQILKHNNCTVCNEHSSFNFNRLSNRKQICEILDKFNILLGYSDTLCEKCSDTFFSSYVNDFILSRCSLCLNYNYTSNLNHDKIYCGYGSIYDDCSFNINNKFINSHFKTDICDNCITFLLNQNILSPDDTSTREFIELMDDYTKPDEQKMKTETDDQK